MKSSLTTKGECDKSNRLQNLVAEQLVGCGFNEILNNSLTRAAYYDGLESYPAKNLVMLMNPLSADLNAMRQTLLFGGLESIAHNANRKNADLKFFEFGNCYYFNEEKRNPEKALAPYSEDYHLGLWITGKRVSNSWAHQDEDSSVYELKAYVENIFARLGLQMHDLVVGNLTDDIYAAALSVQTKGGKRLATFGVVTRKLLKAFDIDNEVYYADLNWKTSDEGHPQQQDQLYRDRQVPCRKPRFGSLVGQGRGICRNRKGGLFHREEVAEGSDALRCLRREESGSWEEELRRELRAAR